MKKIFAIASLMTLCLTASFKAAAIEAPKPAGTKTIGIMAGIDPFYRNTGIGGLAYFDYTLANWGIGHFAVGGQFGFEGFANTKVNAFSVAPRATYGINITDKFEAHVGLSMGYSNLSGYSRFYHGEFIGMNYNFSPFLQPHCPVGLFRLRPRFLCWCSLPVLIHDSTDNL